MSRAIPKYVYLLSTCSYGPDGYIKVGVSNDYWRRFKQIDKSTPFAMRLIVAVSDKNPLALEQAVLEEFKQYRYRGEWFYVKKSLDLDCTKCTYREYMRDLGAMEKILHKEMEQFLVSNADGEAFYGR